MILALKKAAIYKDTRMHEVKHPLQQFLCFMWCFSTQIHAMFEINQPHINIKAPHVNYLDIKCIELMTIRGIKFKCNWCNFDRKIQSSNCFYNFCDSQKKNKKILVHVMKISTHMKNTSCVVVLVLLTNTFFFSYELILIIVDFSQFFFVFNESNFNQN